MDSEVKQRLDAELAKFDGSGADVGKLSPGAGALTTKLALYIADKLDQLGPGGGGGKVSNVVFGSGYLTGSQDPKYTYINTFYVAVTNPEIREGITHWYYRKDDGTEILIPFDYEKPYLFIPFAAGSTYADYVYLRNADGTVPGGITVVDRNGLDLLEWNSTYQAWKYRIWAGLGYTPYIRMTFKTS